MRPIGHLTNEQQARRFGDFLLTCGIHNDVESDADAKWSVWIREEDRVAEASKWLEEFRTNPDAPQFGRVKSEAERIRRAEAEERANYQRRVRTRQSLFPKFGGFGVGPLTFSLILVCVIVAIYSRLGQNEDFLQQFYISYPQPGQTGVLPEVFNGEVWRLITPIFIHFGVLHLLFNMLWLFQFGCMVEGRQGSGTLALLVLVFGIVSDLTQYLVSGPFFGGMSGVVYALAGYIWMRGKHDHTSGLYLDRRSIEWLLIWLVLCFTGILGHVANAAHLGGLVVGALWGRVSAWFASRRPE